MILVVFLKLISWTRAVAWDQAREWGEKAKNGVKQGKKSSSEASPAVARGDYLSEPIFFRLRRFFFPFSLNAEPGPWLPVRL